jgi:hypothetical protein
MNKRAFLTSAVAAMVVVGCALVMHGLQTQAQPLPLDECIETCSGSPIDLASTQTLAHDGFTVIRVTSSLCYRQT